MKVVILAGGFGSRLSEETVNIPKPMVRIGSMPIIWHIMKNFSKQGHKDFIICLGYKSEVVKRFFMDYHTLNSDITIKNEENKRLLQENAEINKIKEETKATIRCIPLNNKQEKGLCIYSQKPSTQKVIFAKAY